MKAVADASSLIHAAKVSRFWTLLRDTFEVIYIPEAVYREILRGREIQSPEVPVIEKTVSEGWIKVVEVKSQPRLPENLGQGEKEAIVLMEEMKLDWLLLDDRVASMTARLRGLRLRSVGYLPIYWREKGLISKAEAVELLDDLIETGYYLNSRDYMTIRNLIDRSS